jgi:hypothetical protein
MTEQKIPTFEGWAILELMGHRKLGGYVSQEVFAGAGLIRIDVPGEDGKWVAAQLYSPSALYCLTPVTEDVARRFAKSMQPEPVTRWELPPASKEDEQEDGEVETELPFR